MSLEHAREWGFAAAGTAAAPAAPGDCVVLGIGNILLCDDGVGIHLVEQLRAADAFPATRYVDGGTLSFSLLGELGDVQALLVVDAAELGAEPGSVRVFENEAMDRFLASPRRRSVHEAGLGDLLDMARLQDCLPRQRALICVQPADVGWNDGLSAQVAAALPAAGALAAEILERWRRSS